MAEQEQTAQEELREAVWGWGQKAVVTLVLFGAGYLGGYFQWGDAAELRHQKKQIEDQVVDLNSSCRRVRCGSSDSCSASKQCFRSWSEADTFGRRW